MEIELLEAAIPAEKAGAGLLNKVATSSCQCQFQQEAHPREDVRVMRHVEGKP